MGDTDLRLALAIGWLVTHLAQAQGRHEADIAADLFAYLDSIDARLPTKAARDAS
jgi:hypothetical protein